MSDPDGGALLDGTVPPSDGSDPLPDATEAPEDAGCPDGPSERVCGDGLDHDCDGTLDDQQPPCACTNTNVTMDDANDQQLDVVWNGDNYGVAYERNGTISFLIVTDEGEAAGEPQEISTVPGVAEYPNVVWTGTEFAVVWHDRRGGVTPDSSGLVVGQIYFARVNASSGMRIGGETRLVTTDVYALHADIAWTGTEYGVVWEDLRGSTFHDDMDDELVHEVYFTRVSSAGVEQGDDILISSDPAFSYEPRLVWAASEYGVVWSDRRHGDEEVYFARVSTSGSVGPEIRLTEANGNSHQPWIAWNGADYGLIWRDRRDHPDGDIFFSRLSATGMMLSGDAPGYGIKLTDSTSTNFPGNIAATGDTFAMVWSTSGPDSEEVYYALISNTGAEVLAPARLTNVPSGEASRFQRVTSGDEHYGIVWIDGRAGSNDIYFDQVSNDEGTCR